MAAPRAEVGPSVVRQPLLGDPGELEQQHVPRLLVLLEPARAHRRRMPYRQHDEMIDARSRQRSESPRQSRAPIVADDVGPRHPRVVHHRQHIARQRRQRIRLAPPRACPSARTRAGPGRSRESRRRPAPGPDGATAAPCRGTHAATRPAGRRRSPRTRFPRHQRQPAFETPG